MGRRGLKLTLNGDITATAMLLARAQVAKSGLAIVWIALTSWLSECISILAGELRHGCGHVLMAAHRVQSIICGPSIPAH
jgi:hypothetical protein